MAEKNPRSIIPRNFGFIQEMMVQIRLIIRLLADRRVSPFLKVLPVGSLLYLIFPFDIPGPLDDIAIVWLGFYIFLEMCPQDVVEEHLNRLLKAPAQKAVVHQDEVVDAEYTDLESPPEPVEQEEIKDDLP